MTYEIPEGAQRRPCAACGAMIAMVRSPQTWRLVPIAIATGRSHFEDCTDPDRFSGTARRAAARGVRVEVPATNVRQEKLF